MNYTASVDFKKEEVYIYEDNDIYYTYTFYGFFYTSKHPEVFEDLIPAITKRLKREGITKDSYTKMMSAKKKIGKFKDFLDL